MVDAGAPSDSAAVAAQLDRAEQLLGRGEVGAAVDALGAAAEQLGRGADQPRLLGRAAWLAALVALLEGDRDGFYRHSEGAVMSLRFAGDTAAATRVALAGADLGARVDDQARVRDQGLVGLLEVLARSVSLLLDIAGDGADDTDPRWQLVNRDREELPPLMSLIARLTGQPAPLERIARLYSLDPLESVLISVLAPLSAFDVLAELYVEVMGSPRSRWFTGDGLARLCFTQPLARQAARNRLASGGRLHRERLIEVSPDPPCVRLAAGIDVFLQGGWVSPAGDSVAAVEFISPRSGPTLVPQLDEARRKLERLLASSNGGAITAVIARPGSGKRSLVSAAAATAGRNLLTIRLGAIAGNAAAVLQVCRRDALLHNAIAHVDLPEGVVPEPLLALLRQPGPTWAITLPQTTSARVLELLRRERPDLVVLELESLAPDEQARLWSSLIRERGCESPPEAELEVEVCRPGLVVGDLVVAIERVLGERLVTGRADSRVEAAALGDALTASLIGEMTRLAEPMAWAVDDEDGEEEDLLGAAAKQALIEIAEAIEGGPHVFDQWQVSDHGSSRLQPVVVHVYGDHRARAQLVSYMASSVAMPPFRVDLAALAAGDDGSAETLLAPIFAAAGRLGATLVLEPIEDIIAPEQEAIARAIARQLDLRLTSVVLSGARSCRLPAALDAHVEWSIATDPEQP